MAESYTQLAVNSTGNKIREIERVIGVNTVRQQTVFQSSVPTYAVIADECAFANSKQHISIWNGVGSGKVLRIQKLFVVNVQGDSVVAGVMLRMNVRFATSVTDDGTNLTPLKADTSNPDIPAQILFKTGATVSEGGLLFPMTFCNDEFLITQNSLAQIFLAGTNWIAEGWEIQEPVLREGEGITVRQVTNTVVGKVTWMIVFRMEDD